MKSSLYTITALFVVAALTIPAVVFSTASVSEETASRFVSYYDQLDANGKAIYDSLDSVDAYTYDLNIDLPVILTARSDNADKAEEFIEKMIKSTIDDAFSALRLSSPKAYWAWTPTTVHHKCDIIVSGNTATASSVKLWASFVNYSKDPETGEPPSIQKMLDDLNAAVDGFSAGGGSTREKVLNINNYLAKTVTYDHNADTQEGSRYAHDAYGALADPNHYAVCDGYSKAFLLLCEKEGIESVVVTGTSIPSMGNHAWNYVKMDNKKWYAIDVTWNDGKDNKYFLKGGSSFFQTHHQGVFLAEGYNAYPFESPAISSSDYDEDTFDLWTYIWTVVLIKCLLATVIVGTLSFVLYKYAKKKI